MHALNNDQNAAKARKKSSNALQLVQKQAKRGDVVEVHPQRALSFKELVKQNQVLVFDLVFQLIGRNELAQAVCKEVFHQAARRFRKDRYQRYAQVWLLKIASQYVCQQINLWKKHGIGPKQYPLTALNYEERVAILLRERSGLSIESIATVMDLSVGAVEQRLQYGREKIARIRKQWPANNPFSFSKESKNKNSLRLRIAIHRDFDGLVPLPKNINASDYEVKFYREGLEQARAYIQELSEQPCPNFAKEVAEPRIPLWRRKAKILRWSPIPWQYKLALEGGAFLLVGTLAVFFLPTILAYYNGSEADLQKAQAVLQAPVALERGTEEELDLLAADRLVASKTNTSTDLIFDDDFADMDFPSGHHYLKGSAPLAPSRIKASIYRLIVQSENPKEIAPKIQSLFLASEVHERDRSGSIMPGGVYFDGITTEENYAKLHEEIAKLGQTKAYLNQKRNRKGYERARVIVWVQQI